jgi:hypothetical protein
MALKFEPTFASIPTVELGIISLVDQNLQDLYFSRPASGSSTSFRTAPPEVRIFIPTFSVSPVRSSLLARQELPGFRT